MIRPPNSDFPIGIIVSNAKNSGLLRRANIDGIVPIIRKLIDEKSGELCIFEVYSVTSSTFTIKLDEFAKSINGKILKREQFDKLPQHERNYIRLLIALN